MISRRLVPVALSVPATLPAAAGNAPVATKQTGLVLAEPDPEACAAPHPADAFDVRVRFAPEGAPSVAIRDCPSCFETREPGTYALWLAPAADWVPGACFVRIGLRDASSALPSLARFDVPAGGPGRPGCENAPPVAATTGSESGIQTFGGPGQNQNVLLDGTLSFDPDQLPLDRWIWSCGNGRVPRAAGGRIEGDLLVLRSSVPVTYAATIAVTTAPFTAAGGRAGLGSSR